MKKKDQQFIINRFKTQFVDFNKEKVLSPYMIINTYISWLYNQWRLGLITVDEYRALIKVEIEK